MRVESFFCETSLYYKLLILDERDLKVSKNAIKTFSFKMLAMFSSNERLI